jgi:hypothetical protein
MLASTFPGVSFIDISTVYDAPKNFTFAGSTIKAIAAMLSSFEEVILMDCQALAVIDPAYTFDVKAYKRTGSLFWPDYCNARTFRPEVWDLFMLPRPAQWDTPTSADPGSWAPDCDPAVGIEISSGMLVLNKRKVWSALWIAVFVNRHFYSFFDQMFAGTKSIWIFSFNATGMMFLPTCYGIEAPRIGSWL